MHGRLATVAGATLAWLLTFLTACGSPGARLPDATQLSGSRWTTLLIGDDAIRHAGTPTLEFVSGAMVGGYGGCNSYSGKVHVSGRAMRFLNVSQHLVGCEQDVNEQERRFMEALIAVRNFRVESGRLVLLDGDNRQRLLLDQDLTEPSPRSPSRRVASVIASPTPPAPYASSTDSVVSSMSLPDLRNYRVAGLELVTVTQSLGEYFGVDRGALVVRAPSDNLFKLREGDVIVSVNGRQPATGEHALRILGSYRAHEVVRLDLIRQRQAIDVHVALPP
jgi:heat shock protein HslJ